jgi:hypothetical protein
MQVSTVAGHASDEITCAIKLNTDVASGFIVLYSADTSSTRIQWQYAGVGTAYAIFHPYR